MNKLSLFIHRQRNKISVDCFFFHSPCTYYELKFCTELYNQNFSIGKRTYEHYYLLDDLAMIGTSWSSRVTSASERNTKKKKTKRFRVQFSCEIFRWILSNRVVVLLDKGSRRYGWRSIVIYRIRTREGVSPDGLEIPGQLELLFCFAPCHETKTTLSL